MRPFFQQDQRQIRILNQLERYPTITVSRLADQLGLDRATVTKAIKHLMTLINQQGLDDLTLTTNEQGLYYHRKPSFNLATLLPILSDQRVQVIFENCFNHHITSLPALAARLYVSESTVRRLFRDINQTLANYQVRLDTKTLTLSGPEPNVRYAAFQYYWNTYGSVTWPFTGDAKDWYRHPAMTDIPPYDQLKLAFWLAITAQRRRQHHAITAGALGIATSDPEADFATLIRLLDFTSWSALAQSTAATRLLNRVPQAQVPVPELKNDPTANRLYRLTVWAVSVWGNCPLLYDREAQLTQRLSNLSLANRTRLSQASHHQPLLQLKLIEALNQVNPNCLRPHFTLQLMTDSDALARLRTLHQLQGHFCEYTLDLTSQSENADLIITNLTLSQMTVPILYVTIPLQATDWTALEQQFQTLLMAH